MAPRAAAAGIVQPPVPAGGSMWTYPIFVVLFIVGVLVGAAALYLLNIHR